MSTCVVKDIEFMNTSKRLGVHPDNLELIVHEFINKEGNEGSFPTDSYIKEALSGKPFEASRGAIKLWERRYSTPKTFRNLAELQRAVSKAEKFFPREAIGTYRTNDNKYVMQVGTPLLKNPTQSRVDQIVTHLRLSGIPVHGRRGMIRYIRENGLDNVQQGANRLYQMFIGKKARANFEQALRNQRPDMSNEEIKSTLDFLHSLEDNKENTAYIKAAIKWVANRSITLPQDNTKAKQVFSEARKKHIDVMKYNTLGELIASDEMKPKEKEKPKFDPDKAKTFSNKRTVTTEKGRVFTVYDVENNWEGQREVCKALAAHYKVSPWCLSTFTATGEPTQSAKKFWNRYNGVKRRIAYEDGKPVAFSSDEDTLDHENEINNYVDDLVNRLLKDQLSEQEQVDLEKAIDELASSNESQIATTPEYVKEFIDKNPELYKEFEKEWSHVYTINGKENEILKKLLLEYSESVSNFRDGYKDEAFTLGDSGEFGFSWALCLELPETSLANKIKGENELSDREAWWDMEDTHPTSVLGDFIMNERMLSEKKDQVTAEFNRRRDDVIRMAIESSSEEHGVTIQTESLNIKGNKFKHSLYRGQGYAPVIDAEGNLHLHTNYDSLSKLRTLSFDSTIEGAEQYGHRAALNPYIIEIDEDFLDTILPKGEYNRDKVNRGESFRYDEEFNEVRLSFKDDLIIPKGKFNITQTNEILHIENFDDIMSNIGWLQSLEERSEIEEYNGASEITGRVHENDLKSISNALQNTLGTYKGYNVLTILYDVLALQNDVSGSPIEPSKQYKEFINKGLIETENQNGYIYYRPSKDLIKHLTKKLGLSEISKTNQQILNQNSPVTYIPQGPSDNYNDDLPFFKTPNGEIYGFVTPEGEMYLDTRVINEEHPIHEYTHLWDKAVQDRNPGLWLRGVALMKQIPLWNEIANSNQYGAKWRESGITEDKLTNLIASEVHARLVGKEGAEIIRNLAKEKGNKGIVAKLKQWLLDFWKELKSTFGTWDNKELSNLTLEQFNMMTVRDFARGVPLNDITLSNGLTYTQSLNIQREMEAIRQQAIADGTFMKAPNGKPTNLNEQQWLQVRTKAFKEWFGDWQNDPKNASKVVDENGEPLVVYHGTNVENISIFDRTKIPEEQTLVGTGTATFGNFFSDKQDDAKSFAAVIRLRRKSGKATVYDAFLNIKNPMYFETLGDFRNYSSKKGHYNENGDFVSDVKLPEEYDGVIVKRRNNSDDSKEFVAPSSNQIKSATGNVGTFSRTDNNIQMYIENGENENARALENAYVEHQKKVEAQVNNLLDSEAISATELRHVADQVAWLISDHITDLQTKEGYSEKLYGIKKEDLGSLSRADVVRHIGPQKIMDWCRDKWFDANNNNFDFDLDDLLLLDEIKENWEGLMLLAQNTLLTIEKFSITTNPTTAELEVNTDLTANPDDFNSPQDTASIVENEGSQQAHWQVETRTEDVISLMSQQVKLALMGCLRLDADGNPIKSRLGVNERMNIREATNFILRNTQGALTLDAMVAKLSDKVKYNPWISQLVQRLSDKSGKETDFQSQFVSDFIKPFQSYSVVRLVTDETGKSHYESVTVNENPALSDAMKQITTQYKINEHPMFTSEGINRSTFEDLKTQINSLEKFSHTGYNVEDPALKEEAAKTLGYISNLFGYYVTPDMVAANLDAEQFKTMYSSLVYMRNSLEKNLNNRTYDPFNFKNKDSINGNLRNFLKPITMYFDDVSVASFYDSGKMYQSYTTPSYMSKLMAKLSEADPTKFREFMHEEFGKYDWFRDQSQLDKTRGWRNNLIESLSRDPVTREKFKRKVQLNFNKHNYMKNMDDMEYTLSLITEFLAEYNPTGKRQWSWYRVPMQSNKPSSDFIRMERYNDANYQESIAENMQRIFSQELSRIQTVRLRNFSKEDLRYIKNLDKNGRKFCFLDFMNDYLEGSMKNSELGRLINDKLDGKRVNLDRLYTLSKNAILQKMTIRANEIVQNWENQGILDAAKKISNAGLTKDEVRENLTNFVWNDTLAAMNIMELTITDIAYYKDAEDLQKRLAQLHAPGIRGNVMATDYEGKLVSDGKERTFYLADFDNFVSNIVDNVSIVFDRKIDAARRRGATEEVKGLEALKDSLVRPRTYKEDGSIDDEGGAFWNINVADAQAYNSPTSYRKKAFIFGKWSRQAEDIYQKLRKGEYNYSDLKTAFQPLKPFVYSQIEKSTGVDGAPMRNLKMGVQNKNSEYLLIMADAMLQGENTGKPNLLRAIYNVMESSHYDEVTGEYKRDGIDTVQFVSAVKVGETGVLSLNEYLNDENGEAIAENVLKAHIYNTTTTINPETGEAVESREYNNNVVHAIPFEDYCLQQEVPQHFREHGDGQLHGSQLRYIVPSELADYNDAGEAVTYEVEGRKLSAKEFKAEYERTVAANIEDSINELSEMLGLNKTGEDGGIDIVKRNTTLSKLLQKEILSSPRYGIDLYQACSVDENGKFRIPLGDPIQSKRVEQLINSIIKNHINKQKIAGGPAVQVSNFGTSRQLNIRFKDKNGGMLMTRDEWEKSTSSSKGNSFKEYISQNQGGIAYFEVLAPIGATPIYANGLFEEFTDKNGAINIEAIEMLSPELLKMIGYRIPTEAKYSMAPLKIVGFLPREAGDGIMLPYDITLLTGSDFDVDKEYLMRKDYKINRTKISKSAMASLLYNELIDSQKERGKLSYELKRKVDDLVQRFLSDPFDKASLVGTKTSDDFLGMTEGAYKKLLRTYVKNRYVLEDPADIKAQRNNKIVDMTYEVLTHETSAAEMLNPGGFDPQKRMGYMVSVARATNIPWSQLQRMSIKELKDLANKNKNLMYIDTHIQFYRQNNAAGSLIGIFAVNRTAHAVIENEGYRLDVDGTLDFQDGDSFTVAGMEFAGLMPIDVRFDRSGESVGKVLGSLVASAADAVKDPVLNLMNINSNTANILTTLIRLGMPFNDAALFLSQSVISEALGTLSKQNIDGFSSLTKVVNDMIKKMEKDTGIDTSSPISREELTRQELISGLKPGNDKVNYKVLQALSHFIKLADAMRMPTTATRFNSMSSAVGPLIVDNLMTEYKLNDLSSNSTIVDNNGDPIGIEDILEAHPILQQFARTLGIAQDLFGNMPANSTGFRNLLNSVVGTQVGKALMNDRRLMSKLSDFYQSYLVVAGNVVDSSRLEEVINNFPKEFIDGNYKERYRDNGFIQAIRLDTDKSGRPTLKIDTTGLDTGQKERLSCGWIDLHRVNPELSLKLFEYCFFRGGIGFNPKTFMNLVPVFIKERIPHYTEAFERLPFTEASSIMDQFIRHNWNEKKLVRHIDTQKDKDHPFFINTIDGKTVILANEEIATSKYKLGVGDYVVIKNFNNSDRDILCKFTQHSEDIGPNLLMQEVDPLGDNGEFVEITVEGRENSIAPATVAMEDNAPSEVTQETETDGPQQDDVEMTPEEEEELLYKIFMSQTRDRDAARAEVERHKSLSEAVKEATERGVKTYMKNRFEALGLAFNEDKINRLYKRMC